MFCHNCGEKLPDNAGFCPKCGTKLMPADEVKTVKLRCKNCNAVMEMDADKKELTCQYCGSKEVILESDTVTVEKLRSDTYKEVEKMHTDTYKELEYARMEEAKKQQEKEETKEKHKSYKKGALSKITIIVLILCLIFAVFFIGKGEILAGAIAGIQVVILGLSWLLGMQIIKEKKAFFHIALAVLGFVLIIPFIYAAGKPAPKKLEPLTWPETGIASAIPAPGAEYGNISVFDESIMATINNVDDNMYAEYRQSCKDAGYDIDAEELSGSYEAFNPEGYKLRISHIGDTMSIYLDAPIEMSEIKWPSGTIAQLLPIPDLSCGNISSDSDKEIIVYIGNLEEGEYDVYIEALKAVGFDKDYHNKDTYYEAYNDDGDYVVVKDTGFNTMSIHGIKDFKKKTEETESAMETTVLETTSPETVAETAAVETTTEEFTTAEQTKSGAREFIDSYEGFIDEYIAFMTSYDENTASGKVLLDYLSLTAKYVEMAAKAEMYDTSEMSDADSAYYLEVLARCNYKLAQAAININ
ncbi:MAG: zinc ribbon domain-containing protein [Parasporobacterium sp.]|nr:zinc ribbon domain-containing protein [Parasporobacterium sp.]